MNGVVLDANVALDWFLESDVGDIYSLALEALAEQGKVRFCVPEHFQIEVSRILIIRGRKGKTPLGEKWLESAPLSLDAAPIDTYAQGINFDLMGKLSKAYGLDAPDVPYFHLAREMAVPIATRDRAIIAACRTWNVEHWMPQVATFKRSP